MTELRGERHTRLEVRKIIYTTNAIESLNASIHKAIRNKGHFPSDQAAYKLIWMALRHIEAKWKNLPPSRGTLHASNSPSNLASVSR